MSEKINIENSNYIRHKILVYKGKRYLIDLDDSLLYCFFPSLIWIRPIVIYEIDSDNEFRKKSALSKKGWFGLTIIIASLTSALFTRLLPENFYEVVYIDNVRITIGLMVLLHVVAFSLKCFQRQKDAKVGKNRKMVQFRYNQAVIRSYYLQRLFGFVILFTIYGYFLHWFITKGNLLVGVLIALGTIFYYFLNNIIVPIKPIDEIVFLKE
ncbi:DUF443 family protein [Streptococcus iners]|uniref:DUF443 family protein n=1 Tax=Streptococcus iners subsp. hyiners TaxID=3028083 RepID=A0AA97AC52_9STRE|nr:DUF443 family protein [Streptococcus sp. 29892]MCK4030200.1 DUF443 family protein [Streptococcus suis]WNY48906.1 DUF443 family protein [Streptococcus sp. 29892]